MIIEAHAGADIKIKFEAKTNDGQIEDLTNGILQFIVKQNHSDPDSEALHTQRISSEEIEPPLPDGFSNFDAPATGVQNITITDEESKTIGPGLYYAQIKYTNESGLIEFDNTFKIRLKPTIFE